MALSLQSKIQTATAILAEQSLPAIPQEILFLKEELHKKYPNTVTIANLISRNPEYLSDFLQIANTNVTEEIETLKDAKAVINLIGLGDVFNLFLATVFSRLLVTEPEEKAIIKESMQMGLVAAELAHWVYGVSRSEAYMMGLLQNIGYLFMRRHDRLSYEERIKKLRTNPFTHYEQEEQAYGTDHAVMSGILGRRWKLPDALVKAAIFHHQPSFQSKLATNKEIQNLVALSMVASFIVYSGDDEQYVTQELKEYGKLGKLHLKLPDIAMRAGHAALKKWGNSLTLVSASH